MKHIQILFSTFVLTALLACGEKDPVHHTRHVSGAEATIPWEDCAQFTDHGLTICFVGANEYRCPCNAECFWEGAIDASFHVTSTTGIDTIITLTTNSNPVNLPNTAVVGGKTIRFVNTALVDCANFGQYEHYQVIVAVE